MSNYKKIVVIFLLVIFFLFVLVNFSFAAERELEVPIPGLETTKLPVLPEYIAAIYNFALMIIGIVCFGALLYGGFRYLTSAGKPAAITDAKDQILSALLGLIILFSSYLILTTINPELVILGALGEPGIALSPTWEAGVNLYADTDFGGKLLSLLQDTDVERLGEFHDNASSVELVNLTHEVNGMTITDLEYGAVLHEHPGFEGRCSLIRDDVNDLGTLYIGNDTTSSVSVFTEAEEGYGKVVLYEEEEFGYKEGEGETGYSIIFRPGGYQEYPDFTTIYYPESGDTSNLNDNVRSIEIKGNYLVIIFEHPNFEGKCEVFRVSDRNLRDNPIGRCTYCWPVWPFCWEDVCPSSMIIIPIGAK